MKKGILFLIVGIFLLSLISFTDAEENCDLALPRYGIVECFNMGQQETKILSLQEREDSSIGSYSCLSNCKLNTKTDIPQSISCGVGWGVHIEIKVNGEQKYYESSTQERIDQDISFNRGEELTFIGYCRGLLGKKSPLPISSINVKQDLIMLKEGWAGSLPTTTIPNTEGCTLNSVLDRYKGDTDVSSFFNPVSGQNENKPSSTFSSVSSMPTNWEIGQNYIFVKDWQTGIADISLTYDKNNKGYWCGGMTGSRKIYSVNQITSNTGKCYAIPSSVYLSNIECCFPSDCSYKGSKYTCNPDNWKCQETKPCNSQLECDQVFGEGVCQDSQITKWTCDTNKKWGNYAGTCISSQRNVQQCPSDCSTEEYYNEDEGKCKPRNVLINCPSGKCCLDGGSYKEKLCSSGLQCCVTEGYLGECQSDCNKKSNPPPGTGFATRVSGKSSSFGIIILIVFLILIGGAIGFYFYKNKSTKAVSAEAPVERVVSSGGHCTKCGSSLNLKSRFCTKCGERFRK